MEPCGVQTLRSRGMQARFILEPFGQFLIEGTTYNVTEIEKGKKYLMRHNNATKREKWSRVVYEVTIKDDDAEYECECGQFEHMGMILLACAQGNGHVPYFVVAHTNM